MAITKVLIDTNVCLDAIQRRKPFAANAYEIIERSQRGEFEGMIAAHSFDTIFYFINKKVGYKKAYKGVRELRKAFDVAPVTKQVVDYALNAEWKDFEDAIHYEAARAEGCQAIVTRNENDFEQAGVPVLSPHRFLEQLNKA